MHHFYARGSRRRFGSRPYPQSGLYLLGIDAGTSSVKSLIMDTSGHVIDIARSKYGVIRENNLYAEQNINQIWEACLETLNILNKNNPGVMRNIKAVGLSGQMHGLVMIGEDDLPLRNAIIWEDQRAGSQIQKIYEVIGRERFCDLTLNKLNTGYLITSLMWVRDNEPEIFEKIKSVMFVKDYLRFKLCGVIATDVTDASGSPIFETAKREWAWKFFRDLELPEEIFPPCFESYETAGEVTSEAARLTGLKAGTPIVFGGGDTLMSAVGTGTGIIKNFWGVNIGTGCQVLCAANQPLHDKEFRTNTFCYVNNNNERLWTLMGANLCGGAAMRWLASHILNNIKFEELDRLAAQAEPGSDGVMFLPFLNGSRNNPDMRGVFSGLSLHHDRSHLARAILEGVIFSLKDSYNLLKDIAGYEPEYIVASGGGASSELALQIEANVFNKPIYTTKEPEEACTGAAITAAVGAGFFDSFDEACNAAIKFNDKIIEPDAKLTEFYNARFEVYKDLLAKNFEV